MTEKVKSAFELRGIAVPLDRLLPIRQIKPGDHCFGKYRSILASIREIGVVEPLVIHPQRGAKDIYLILDGHMRWKALKELGKTEAPCLIATEDDAFTYNDKVSRIAPIQEHRMIMRAIEQGVTPEDIARSLDVEVDKIRRGLNLLDGIHPDAVDMLKDKPITEGGPANLQKGEGGASARLRAPHGQHGQLHGRVTPARCSSPPRRRCLLSLMHPRRCAG
jgi:ParB-like chromosome segregation protein Spo0J